MKYETFNVITLKEENVEEEDVAKVGKLVKMKSQESLKTKLSREFNVTYCLKERKICLKMHLIEQKSTIILRQLQKISKL